MNLTLTGHVNSKEMEESYGQLREKLVRMDKGMALPQKQ